MVDDEDILRVVVAEEGLRMTTTSADVAGGRGPHQGGAARTSSPAQAAPHRPEAAGHPGRLGGPLLRLPGQETPRDRPPGHHRPAPEAQRSTRLGAARGPGQLVLRRRARRYRRRPQCAREFFQELISIPAFPRPVPEIGWLGRDRAGGLSPRSRSPACAPRSWSRPRCCSSASSASGRNSMDLLIVTLLAVVLCIVIGIPIGIWMARKQDGVDGRHAGPRRDADAAGVLLPGPAGACSSASDPPARWC